MKNSRALIVFTFLITTCALSSDNKFACMIVALPESKFRMEGDTVYMPVSVWPYGFGFELCIDPEVREEECEDAQVITSEVAWNLCTASRVVDWSEAFSQKCAAAMSTLSEDIYAECQRLAHEYAASKKVKHKRAREAEYPAMPNIHEFLESAELGARAAGLQMVERGQRGVAFVPGPGGLVGGANKPVTHQDMVAAFNGAGAELQVHMTLAVEADMAALRVAQMTGDTSALPQQSRLGGVVRGAVEHARGSVRALAGGQSRSLIGGRRASAPTLALEDCQWQTEGSELGFSLQDFEDHAWVDNNFVDAVEEFFEPVMKQVRAYEQEREAIIAAIDAGDAPKGAEQELRVHARAIDDAAQDAGQRLAIRMFMETAGMSYAEAAAFFEG